MMATAVESTPRPLPIVNKPRLRLLQPQDESVCTASNTGIKFGSAIKMSSQFRYTRLRLAFRSFD